MKGDVRVTLSHRRSAFARPRCETLRGHPVSQAMWESRCSFSCGDVCVCVRQAAEHDVGQAQVDIGAAAGHGRFVFTAKQAKASQPAEGAFYDPAVRQNHEPRQVISAFDDLQFPTELLWGGLHQLASIAAIGPDLFESCLTAHRSEDLLGSVAILHAVYSALRRSSSAMKRGQRRRSHGCRCQRQNDEAYNVVGRSRHLIALRMDC